MTGPDFAFSLNGAELVARPSGVLWWPSARLLCVSDLHLGKSERIARRGGAPLPPFETADTLQRLDDEIAALNPAEVICLGDSFDDDTAARALPDPARLWIARLQAGRRWIWIAGNHDPAPVDLGGSHLGELARGPLIFRHIADPNATGEVSGHYHPKAAVDTRAGRITRRCFLLDDARLILPAFGTYTGGLHSSDATLARLMRPEARALLTGKRVLSLPMPRK